MNHEVICHNCGALDYCVDPSCYQHWCLTCCQVAPEVPRGRLIDTLTGPQIMELFG